MATSLTGQVIGGQSPFMWGQGDEYTKFVPFDLASGQWAGDPTFGSGYQANATGVLDPELEKYLRAIGYQGAIQNQYVQGRGAAEEALTGVFGRDRAMELQANPENAMNQAYDESQAGFDPALLDYLKANNLGLQAGIHQVPDASQATWMQRLVDAQGNPLAVGAYNDRYNASDRGANLAQLAMLVMGGAALSGAGAGAGAGQAGAAGMAPVGSGAAAAGAGMAPVAAFNPAIGQAIGQAAASSGLLGGAAGGAAAGGLAAAQMQAALGSSIGALGGPAAAIPAGAATTAAGSSSLGGLLAGAGGAVAGAGGSGSGGQFGTGFEGGWSADLGALGEYGLGQAGSGALDALGSVSDLVGGGQNLGAIIGGIAGATQGNNPQTASNTSKLDPVMQQYLYGTGFGDQNSLLGAAMKRFQENPSGINPMMQQGLDMSKAALTDPAYAQGFQNMRNVGSGLLGGQVAANPFTQGLLSLGGNRPTFPTPPTMPEGSPTVRIPRGLLGYGG